ncbi:ATP-binding protein [Burkholderia sp. 22PA0099]|uniref:ATP-binding protein n=1 Tax=Burkholderia sp. 22PA0099 TaxID=3237372 RepID=UPI0039C11CA8
MSGIFRSKFGSLRRGAARSSIWLQLAGTALLAVLGCAPAVEELMAPLDRRYWHLAFSGSDHGPRDKVAVIMIDKKTFAELGDIRRYVRADFAGVLERVAGASSVVLDMMMISPTRDDAGLAAVIARRGDVVLPAHVTLLDGRADTVMLPSKPLREAAAAIGQRRVTVSSNQLVQGIVPFIPYRAGEAFAHVSLQAIRVAQARHPGLAAPARTGDRIAQAERDGAESVLLFLPPRFDLDRYSFVDVLKGRVPDAAWRNRIVFIGDGMSDLAGVFYLSPGSAEKLRRAEVDALATEALLDGHLIRRMPPALRGLAGLAVATGVLLICLFVPGWRMYGFVLAWLALFVAGAVVALVYGACWAPVGPPLAVCVTIFSICGWRRADWLRAALMREYRGLRGLAHRHAVTGLAQTAAADDPAPGAYRHDSDVAKAMSRIRAWQSTYVDVIHTLPYPVFVEQDGALRMCNACGHAMLGTLDADRDTAARRVLDIARDTILAARDTGRIHSVELTMNARIHMMMVTPFGGGDPRRSTGSMICLVDIHTIKAAVESDRLTLRHMAHDLRNPLSTVLSLLEQRGVADAAPTPEFLADLHKLVDYSLRVAEDFTQLSRAEHLDKGAYVPVSVGDWVMEAVDQVWHAANAKQIRLEWPDEADGEVFVFGNRNMLLRALINLLDNAIKYSEAGTTIDVWIDAGDGRVSIVVVDAGCGIPEAAMPRLFEPFFQVGGAERDASRGVGLGLPFVKAVVERHGGSIDVASVPGRGSRFTVCLPVAGAEGREPG